MRKNGISQETLKIIACVTMLLDHIGAAVWPSAELRVIGRLAFPIYCFLLAEGIHYTKNPKGYGLRILVGLALSEVPFDLLFFGRLTWGHQNVMVTLLLGYLYGMVQKRASDLGIRIILLLPFLFLAEWLRTDYGGWGVAMVGLFVLTRDMPNRAIWQVLGLGLISWMIGGMGVAIGHVRVPIQLFALFALLPIWCYSGHKATGNVWIQRMFYLFYPLHLAALLVIVRL